MLLAEAAAAAARAIDDGAAIPWGPMNAAAQAASRADKDAAVAALLDGARDAPPMSAALRLIASGSLVEAGATPATGIDIVLDVVARIAEALVPLAEADKDLPLDGPAGPDDKAACEAPAPARAWPLAVVGAMARLARDVDARKRLRAHPGAGAVRAIFEATGAQHAGFLTSVLDMLDDEPLLLIELDGPRPVVRRLRAFGVRGGFHLIALLEGRDCMAHARSGARTVEVEAGWFTWGALEVIDGRPRARHLGNSLWGEMRAVDLPRLPRGVVPAFDDVRVAVRDKKLLGGRFFSVNFIAPIHDALEDKLVDEGALAPADADALIAAILAAIPTREP